MESTNTDLVQREEQVPSRTDYAQGQIGSFAPTPDDRRPRLIVGAIAIVVALVSFFVLGKYFSDPETYRSTMEVLDQKKDTVMNLVGASTGSSAAISLLPGDAGTPIAEKLVDLSSDFLVVIAAIYLEKYLLTILGFAAWKVLIPVGCLLLVGALMLWHKPAGRAMMLRMSTKLTLFGLAVFLVVPVSVRVSGMIEDTYQASINQTIQTAEQTTDAIENSANEGESTDSNNPLSFLINMPEELNKLTESAKSSLNNFIEALAVMIVTSCIIPILVLLFFVWLVKTILGINIDLPVPVPRTARINRRLRK